MTSTLYESTTAVVHVDCKTWPVKDQHTWCALFDPADPKAPQRWSRRRQKPWSRSRQYNVARIYTRYLACVRRQGLTVAITPKGVRTFVEEIEQTCSTQTVHSQLCALTSMARLLDPDNDWSFLDKTCRNLGQVARNTPKQKNSFPLVDAHELYRTGVTMMREALEQGGTAWPTLQTFRDGLFLVLGTMCPERARALENIRVGAVDTRLGVLDIPASDLKTGEPSRRRLSPTLVAAVDVWLKRYRGAYAPAHGYFWIAKGGGPVRPDTLRVAMKAATRNRLGIAVPPHRLRDAAATSVVEEMPEHAALASVLLQHTSEKMTRNYQERATEIEASRRFAKHIDDAQTDLEQEISNQGTSTPRENPGRERP